MKQKLPHSADAEKALIGALLLDNGAFEQVRMLSPADFFLLDHSLEVQLEVKP